MAAEGKLHNLLWKGVDLVEKSDVGIQLNFKNRQKQSLMKCDTHLWVINQAYFGLVTIKIKVLLFCRSYKMNVNLFC